MRTTIIGLLLSCGLIAAASACPYASTQASNQQTPAQTADAQTTAPVETSTQ
jgi:hypothetical protein